MAPSQTFARHLARLVWLLERQPTATVELQAALDGALAAAALAPVTLSTRGERLLVDGAEQPPGAGGLDLLAARLIVLSALELRIDKAPLSKDVLGLARALAADGTSGANGAARLAAIESTTVHAITQGAFGRTWATPTPAIGVPVVTGPRSNGMPATLPAIVSEEQDERYHVFASTAAAEGTTPGLFAALDAAATLAATTPLLDRLALTAESAERAGDGEAVADILYGLIVREALVEQAEIRTGITLCVRRLTAERMLRAVALRLPRRKGRVEQLLAVLARAGDEGADVVVERLAAEESKSDRRAYFDALKRLNAGVPTLLHMLGDAQWYVVRNAAELLGEMHVEAAEASLIPLLTHDDHRVRRAAATALGKIGTTGAIDSLRAALRAAEPAGRAQAAAGLAARRGVRVATTMVRALNAESDAEVQHALLAALGRLRTPDAVQRLAQAAAPDSWWASVTARTARKLPAYRIAAAKALADAGTPEARLALDALRGDGDREVRAAVERLTRAAAVGRAANAPRDAAVREAPTRELWAPGTAG